MFEDELPNPIMARVSVSTSCGKNAVIVISFGPEANGIIDPAFIAVAPVAPVAP